MLKQPDPNMANRGKYVKHQQMYDSAGNPIYGRTTGKVSAYYRRYDN